jgi:hypothetical protein
MIKGEFYTHSKKHAKSMKLKTLNEVSKSLCKIYIEKINSRGTGFFLLINVSKEEKLYMLVTAFHVINFSAFYQIVVTMGIGFYFFEKM